MPKISRIGKKLLKLQCLLHHYEMSEQGMKELAEDWLELVRVIEDSEPTTTDQ